jgi:hypothetical protein
MREDPSRRGLVSITLGGAIIVTIAVGLDKSGWLSFGYRWRAAATAAFSRSLLMRERPFMPRRVASRYRSSRVGSLAFP